MKLPAVVGLGLAAVSIGAGASEISGDVTLGWRNVSVDGATNKYRQHINLSDGARLQGLRFEFRANDAKGQLPDRVVLEASNLGGDPFENVHFRLRKYGNYDFRYDHRKSSYFYNDLLVDPANASIAGSTGGDFHRFDFDREQDRIALDLYFTPRATGSLVLNRYTKSGSSTTTRDIQRDEFEIDQTIDEVDQSVAIDVQYRWDRTTLAIEQSFGEYDNKSELILPGLSLGENPGDLTLLDFYFFDQPYGYDSNQTRLSLSNRPNDRLEWRFRWQVTDLRLDFSAAENAQGVDFLGNPFTSDETFAGEVDRDVQVVDLDGSFALTDNVNLIAGAQHRELEQDGRLDIAPENGSSDWDIKTVNVDLGVEYSVTTSVTIAAGWSVERRDVDSFEEFALDLDAASIDTERDGFFATLDYRPSGKFHVGVAIESNQVDDPYTLASPTDSVRYRLRGRYKFDNGISLSFAHKVRDYDNDNTDWSREHRQTDLRLAYDTERLQLSAGASFLDLSRDYVQLVTGGGRQDLFSATYRGETTIFEGRARYSATDALTVGAKLSVYDNDRSFKIDRRDISTYVEYSLPQNYMIYASYRNVDYEEDLEQYEVDIVEFGVGLRW